MEPNQYLCKQFNRIKGKKFDVIVMYTGGKDSSYLIYLLKEIYKLRVLAVTVDNGYEFSTSHSRMSAYLDKINVPLKTLKIEKTFFTKLYRELIVNPNELNVGDKNHICHICNNVIWMTICQFAAENKVPFVASGLSLEQLNSGRKYPLSINEMANKIAAKSTKMINQQVIKYMLNNAELNNNLIFKKLKAQNEKKDYIVTTIYPYIYHSVNVEEQKKTIIEYGSWIPPVDVSIDKYVSSGCVIMDKVIFELEKMGLVVLNEREEAKRMVAAGLIEKEKVKFAYQSKSNEKVNLSDPIFEELGVKDYLYRIAKKKNRL